MQVEIRRSPNSWETILVPSEEDAMRTIKEPYPDAVSVPWVADYDQLDPRGRPSSQIKLVYENQITLGRKSGLIARIRKHS